MMLALPVESIRGRLPWGYFPSKEDPNILEPIDEHFVLLLEAKKYLQVAGYKKVADWLTLKSGVDCPIETLRFIMERRHPINELRLPREQREALADSSK